MNHLFQLEEAVWRLAPHAHIVVYEREASERGLLTIYDCGAAQQPPRAQLLGTLEAVDAPAEVRPEPTGRTVTLRDGGRLEHLGDDRYRVRRARS